MDRSEEKHPLLQFAEPALKLATAILGIFYVLGLMISNAQLMELGIADFASLQARNVMIGFIFVLYVAVLVAIILPIAYIPFAILESAPEQGWSKILSWLKAIARCAFFAIMGVIFAGSLMGYLFVGGRSWHSFLHYHPTDLLGDFLAVTTQFIEAFGRAKILLAAAGIWGAEVAVLAFLKGMPDAAERREVLAKPLVLGSATLFSIIFTVFLLFDYADDVYPNVKYNLGGGQPQVAELQLGKDDAAVDGLPGMGTPASGEKQEQVRKIGPVAIWYQSDKFLYISDPTVVGTESVRVMAIDLKMVRAIRYLPKYVKVASGGRIKSVHPP